MNTKKKNWPSGKSHQKENTGDRGGEMALAGKRHELPTDEGAPTTPKLVPFSGDGPTEV